MSLSRSGDNPRRLAKEFIATYGRDSNGRLSIRYWQNQFWFWRDAHYTPISLAELKARLNLFIDNQFEKNAVSYYRQGHGDKLKSVTSGAVRNVVEALAGETSISDSIDQPAWLGKDDTQRRFVAVQNGLLDLDKLLAGHANALRGHTPEWFSTACLPFEFSAEANCPQWLAFIEQVLEGDKERIALLQEWFGYCLTPNTDQQKFLVLEGEGSNGKSVVCEVLTALLGPENVSQVPLELFGQRFQLTPTLGKLANIASEVGEIDRVAEGTLKAFTSGDRMYFDRKGIPGIEAYPTARLVLATNNRPRFSDRSEGIWRRMLLLPFRITIPYKEQDRQLTAKLREDLPGIFVWAVEGLRRLRENGHFSEPGVCRQALDDYRMESNPARHFLRECYYESADGETSTVKLYEEYRNWCDRNGYKPAAENSFGKEVVRAFPKVHKKRVSRSGKRAYAYMGMCPALGVPAAPAIPPRIRLAKVS